MTLNVSGLNTPMKDQANIISLCINICDICVCVYVYNTPMCA